jgi:hypothetical protein
MATPLHFHDSQWNIEYRSACIEPTESLRPLMVEYAILRCNEALQGVLGSEERMAIYTALGDLAKLRQIYCPQSKLC